MAATPSVRVSTKQVGGSPSSKRSRKTDIPAPDARMYGVFGPQYASYLAQTAGDQGPGASAALAALNAGALSMSARREQKDYAEMLGQAQRLQETASGKDAYYDIMGDVAERNPEYTKMGMGGAESVVWDEKTGMPVRSVDPIQQMITNADVLNTNQSERVGTYAGAIKTLRDSGVAIPDNYMGELLTPPTQETPVPIASGTTPLTPRDETDRYSADEGLTYEQQLALKEAGGTGDEGDEYAEVTVNHGATGEVPTLTYKGTPEQVANSKRRMREQGFDPDTGAAIGNISPKADGTGGDPSATPAANNNKPVKTTQRIEEVPVDGFFAASKVTSPYGKRIAPTKGASSFHKGVDYGYPEGTKIPAEQNGVVLFSGPVKGFGNQVKVRYEDGSVVSYAHNKSNSVQIGDKVKKGQVVGLVGKTGVATGPHVHRQVERNGNPEGVYATRLKSHPLVADVKLVDDNTLVTMKDGSQRVYHKGRRIG